MKNAFPILSVRRVHLFLLAGGFLAFALLAGPLGAQTATFDFDNCTPALTPGQNAPLDQTTAGLKAQFTGNFSIQSDASTYYHLSHFSANYLYPNGTGGVLQVHFSVPLTNITFNLATADAHQIEYTTLLQLTAYQDSTASAPVGSTTARGSFGSDTFPMGTMTYNSGGQPFNLVEIKVVPDQPNGVNFFLVDNLTVQVAPGNSSTITTASFPGNGGTTSGGGTYLNGASITVDAMADPGFQFVNWTENGGEVSTLASYTFTGSSNRTLTANFVPLYTVTTSGAPAAAGVTTGDSAYPGGVFVSVVATPNPGYAFLNWTENGVPVSSSATFSFELTANHTLIANFAPAYAITTSSSSVAVGSSCGDGTYPAGANVAVVATPRTGYAFVNWTENGAPVSTSARYLFTANTGRALVANFAPDSTSVTFDFDTGTPALTTAQATPFDQTSGGLTAHFSSAADPAFSIQADASLGWVMPRFSGNYLYPDVTGGGLEIRFSRPLSSVALTFGTFDFQQVVTPSTLQLTAYQDSTGTPAVGSATAPGSFNPGDTMPSGLLTIHSANPFKVVRIELPPTPLGATDFIIDNIAVQTAPVPTYTIGTSASPAAGGSTSGAGAYNEGANVTVTATPNTGYAFANWTENGSPVSTSASYSFTASANRTLVAHFAPTYSVATGASPANGGTTTGDGAYTEGASVTVMATPNAGYAFVGWAEGGTAVSTSASYSFTASANRTLIANFVPTWTIATSASPAAGGLASGGGTFNDGASVTVIAPSNAGYSFVNWTENGVPVSTWAIYSFTANANRTLVANFAPNWTIATSASPAAGGSVSGGGSFNDGVNVTVVATPNTGYAFVNWTENGTPVSTSPGYSFTASANRALVANFVATYTIATSASLAAGGTTTGDGTYNNGASVALVATAKTGYAFVGWTEGGTTVSTSASYSFTASANRTLVAKFEVSVVPHQPVLQWAGSINGPFYDEPDATVDQTQNRITATVKPGGCFYRLRSDTVSTILRLEIVGDQALLTYQLN